MRLANHFVHTPSLPSRLCVLASMLFVGRGYRVLSSGSGSPDAPNAQDGSMRVFAATFNAGNKVYGQPSAASATMTQIMRGHDDSDLVILGFQEYLDDCSKRLRSTNDLKPWKQECLEHGSAVDWFANRYMWNKHADVQMMAFKDLALREVPQNVSAARSTIARKLNEFLRGLTEQFDDLEGHFCGRNQTYLDHISRHSPVAMAMQHSDLLLSNMTSSIDSFLASYEAKRVSAGAQQFHDVHEKFNAAFNMAVQSLDSQALQRHLQTVVDWNTNLWQEFVSTKNKFPNLRFSGAGEIAAGKFKRELLSLTDALRGITDSSHFSNLKELLASAPMAIQNAAALESDVAAGSVVKFQRETIFKDMKKLESDIAKLGDLKASTSRVALVAKENAQRVMQALRVCLGNWRQVVDAFVNQATKSPVLSIGPEHIVVQDYHQTFYSESRAPACHWVKHFNTDLRVLVNPWSGWEVEAMKSHNINNNLGSQCGKGVNILQLRAKRGASQVFICALNTHLSFKFGTPERMADIVAAMQYIDDIDNEYICDIVIFMGDFNSRLSCEANPGKTHGRLVNDIRPVEKENAFSVKRSTTKQNNIFATQIATFCNSSSCHLGAHSNADELTQLLDLQHVRCYAERNSKYELQVMNNRLLSAGLREAATPYFPFTYKVVKADAAKQLKKEWVRCLPGELICYANADKNAKHNPAWTDRILIRDSVRWKISTTSYEQHPLDVEKEHFSDHTPVIAELKLTMEDFS